MRSPCERRGHFASSIARRADSRAASTSGGRALSSGGSACAAWRDCPSAGWLPAAGAANALRSPAERYDSRRYRLRVVAEPIPQLAAGDGRPVHQHRAGRDLDQANVARARLRPQPHAVAQRHDVVAALEALAQGPRIAVPCLRPAMPPRASITAAITVSHLRLFAMIVLRTPLTQALKPLPSPSACYSDSRSDRSSRCSAISAATAIPCRARIVVVTDGLVSSAAVAFPRLPARLQASPPDRVVVAT